MRITLARKVGAGFLAVLLLLWAIVTVAFVNINRLVENAGWLDHTHQVISVLRDMISHVMELQSATRGFVISDNELFLRPVIDSPDTVRKCR